MPLSIDYKRCNFPPASDMGLLKRLSATALEMLLPATCHQCGRLIQLSKNRQPAFPFHTGDIQASFLQRMKAYLCEKCAEQFSPVTSPMCIDCGIPFVSSSGIDHQCGGCESSLNQYDYARSVGLYETVLRCVIHRYKYHGQTQLAIPLGRLLWDALLNYWDPVQFDCVMPVPLHPVRLRRRGFNQAGLLLRKWSVFAKHKGILNKKKWIIQDALVRRINTCPQTGLSREHRIDNLMQAIAVKNESVVTNNNILLVDDVMTTGATANACARSLKEAGAKKVHVLTLARTV